MNAGEMGRVFGFLLKHREIQGNPVDRISRDGELEVAKAIHGWGSHDLTEFDEFLGAQGFTLYIRDAIELGIPPKPGRPNMIYVITRLRGTDLAPYLNDDWFLEGMRDRRSQTTKQELIFWVTRLWLSMQWCFYECIDRMPSEISQYRDALITERKLLEIVNDSIEELGRTGRPEGDAGLMWDALCDTTVKCETYCKSFIKQMELANMIESAGNPGEYRQTLLAAVEMASIAENELAYLMPPESKALGDRTIDLLVGEINNKEGE